MRLINCLTMQLEEFFGNKIPAYAILSHTWEEEEVTYQDFLAGVTSKKGWIKIKQICERAKEGKYLYAWIDTCCIDKSSSVELTEAINSMYEWYKKSAICYVFLSDLKVGGELHSCRWFTRGWTLQELIASPRIDFLDSLWQYYGSKQKMGHILGEITMVDVAVLGSSGSDLRYMLDSIPVCRRMSWLSRRQTTRVEDIAYCGLGIFDVNMPLLYGEGARAFIRLQEEIIRRRNDFTILAW
ncbi:heterokaryon incompatibility protein-domain-containing protein, partial [Bisporella sp. PMI_857]